MSKFTFELIPFDDGTKVGRAGDVGEFGRISVYYERARPPGNSFGVARLSGSVLPDTVFRGQGPGQPTLIKASLTVGGEETELRFNTRGLRKEARALHIRLRDRSYTYTSAGLGKSGTLARTGIKVTLSPGRHIPKVGLVTVGVVEGAADARDLALAMIFEEVDTAALTLGGAALSAPFTLLYRHAEGAGE